MSRILSSYAAYVRARTMCAADGAPQGRNKRGQPRQGHGLACSRQMQSGPGAALARRQAVRRAAASVASSIVIITITIIIIIIIIKTKNKKKKAKTKK